MIIVPDTLNTRPLKPQQTGPQLARPQPARPQLERLYGRQRSHPLRHRQKCLLDEALPRFRFRDPARPLENFTRPVEKLFLEIGFGGGEHAAEQAEHNPDTGYIAAEVFENGLCSLLSRLVPENAEKTAAPPANLRLWPEDARLLLRTLPDRTLDRAYLMFPDPWPKARHAKRRFMHPENISRMARLLKPGAVWRVASDHPVYQQWVMEMMMRQDFFETPPPYSERPEGWSATRYEAKALREGRQPLYWNFIRKPV